MAENNLEKNFKTRFRVLSGCKNMRNNLNLMFLLLKIVKTKMMIDNDVSEKLFASDKTFLGNKSMRSHTNEGVEGRIFTQFIALIIRNKIYTALQEENEKLEKKQNYMTVPAAIRELEKIEMTRQTDNIYRLDHAVTAKQKKNLKAFGMNEGNITYRAGEISNTLKKSNLQKERR